MNSNKDEEIEIEDEINYIKIKSLEIYPLLNNDNIDNIEIAEVENDIKIKCNKYELNLNLAQFKKLFKSENQEKKSINDCFKYLSRLFINKRVYISNEDNGKFLELTISQDGTKINLEYKENSSYTLVTDLVKILNKSTLDIEKIKEKLNEKDEFGDPKNMKFSNNVINNSYANYSYENSFVIYETQNKNLNIVYATKDKTLISKCIDKITIGDKNSYEIKSGFIQTKAHNNFITSIKYYFDEVNQMEIIMTISKKDNIIKLWNVNDGHKLFNEIKANDSNFLFSACFLKENNESYIITSNGKTLQPNQEIQNFEPLKLYKLDKKEPFKEISDSNDCTYFVDVFYDNNLNNKFIITGNYNYIKAYDYEKDELFHKYYENNNGIHPSVIINTFEEIIKLIESCEDGVIRIWEFYSCNLVRKINTENNNLYGICLWNDKYLFVGSKDQSIKLIDLKNGILIKSFEGHKGRIISLIKYKIDGSENLYSQGLDGTIKCWNIPKII